MYTLRKKMKDIESLGKNLLIKKLSIGQLPACPSLLHSLSIVFYFDGGKREISLNKFRQKLKGLAG